MGTEETARETRRNPTASAVGGGQGKGRCPRSTCHRSGQDDASWFSGVEHVGEDETLMRGSAVADNICEVIDYGFDREFLGVLDHLDRASMSSGNDEVTDL